jgi:hypothetical protein
MIMRINNDHGRAKRYSNNFPVFSTLYYNFAVYVSYRSLYMNRVPEKLYYGRD